MLANYRTMRLYFAPIVKLARLFLMLGVLATSSASEAQDPALFTASVSVERPDATSTNYGKKNAFERVLVRVSGIANIIDHEVLQAALANPDSYITRYQYSRKNTAMGIEPQLFIDVSFNPQQVIDLLQGADLPIWSSPRPRALVWVVIDDSQARYVISSAGKPEYSAILLDEADLRGVPVLLPFMDLTDLSYINLDEIYSGSSNSLRAAAGRYDSKIMLVMRIGQTATEKWQIQWEFWEDGSGDIPLTRVGIAATQTEAIRLGIDWMANQIASLQLSASKDIRPQTYARREKWVQVNSVPDFISYVEVVDFFKQVNGVTSIHLVRMADQSMLLSIRGDISWGQLLGVVRLNSRLTKLDNSDATVLRLAWRG